MRAPRTLTALAVAALALAACSSDDSTADGDTDAGDATTSTSTGADTPTTAAIDTSAASGVYGEMANWMCHPALDDADNRCLEDLDVTVVAADGSTEVVPHEVAEEPAIDCVYIYPTISSDPGGNSDLVPSDGEEVRAMQNQVARFNQVCEVWAPVYRQRTLTALMGGGGEVDEEAVRELAYSDVRDAWDTYLAQSEPGRGVVLVGHSQGSGLLNRLIAEEIDGDEELRSRLVSAYLLGSSVAVPEGEDVGGDFDNVPLCREESQTGCVVTYASFRSTAPPPANSFFGRPRSGEGVAGCVNPAALAGGSAELDAIFPSSTSPWADPASGAEITTPFYAMPGLVSGECVSEGGFSYLEVTVHGDPTDPRADDIGGDLTPEWGLHLVDANLTMRDQLALLRTQADAYTDAG